MNRRPVRLSREIARGLALFGLLFQFSLPFAVAVAATPGTLLPGSAQVLCLGGDLSIAPSGQIDVALPGGTDLAALVDRNNACDHCTLCPEPTAPTPQVTVHQPPGWHGTTTQIQWTDSQVGAAYVPYLRQRGPPARL